MLTFRELIQQDRQVHVRCEDCSRSAILVSADLHRRLLEKVGWKVVEKILVSDIATHMECSGENCKSKNVTAKPAHTVHVEFLRGFEYPERPKSSYPVSRN